MTTKKEAQKIELDFKDKFNFEQKQKVSSVTFKELTELYDDKVKNNIKATTKQINAYMLMKFVDQYHWIDEEEMLDLVAIAQSAPGPIAVNGAIVVGYKLAGLAGTLVAIIGTIIPPFVIISLISAFYHAFRDNYLVSQMLEGMQAGVGAVIASVTYEMGCGIIKKKDNVATIVMIAAFIAACVLGINVIYIVIASGVFGVIRTIWNRRRKRV